jgi:hypothetical protein
MQAIPAVVVKTGAILELHTLLSFSTAILVNMENRNAGVHQIIQLDLWPDDFRGHYCLAVDVAAAVCHARLSHC